MNKHKKCVRCYVIKKIAGDIGEIVMLFAVLGIPLLSFGFAVAWMKERYPIILICILLGIAWAMLSSAIVQGKREFLELVEKAREECKE